MPRPSQKESWPQLVERGVYWLPSLKDGKPQAIAVDSRGEEIDRVVVDDCSWARGEAVVALLWNTLNVADPVEPKARVLELFR